MTRRNIVKTFRARIALAAALFLTAPALVAAADTSSASGARPPSSPYSNQCRQAAKDSVISCTGAGVAVGACAATKSPGTCAGAAVAVAKCANDIGKARTTCEPSPKSDAAPRSTPSRGSRAAPR